jgi:PPOX class probable F420-dependent enzyme
VNSVDAPDGPMLDLITAARRGVLVTIGQDGTPRPLPFCYVARVDEAGRLVLHTPIDEKPKQTDDPLSVARILDIERESRVVVLVDRWDEDWPRLAWVRLHGTAAILPAVENATTQERVAAVTALRAKYPQYATHALEDRPMIRIVVDSWSGWSATPDS